MPRLTPSLMRRLRRTLPIACLAVGVVAAAAAPGASGADQRVAALLATKQACPAGYRHDAPLAVQVRAMACLVAFARAQEGVQPLRLSETGTCSSGTPWCRASGAHHGFFHANRELLDEAEQLEHRARRRDILVDDETLFDFYDERLPADVVSARHFDSWWKDARREQPDLLDFSLEMLVGDVAVDQAAFPSVWPQGDLELPLTYQFEPGTEQDGVTVDIPLSVLARVRPEGFDRLVPGLAEDLVVALIRALPKVLRVALVPAPDAAREVVAWVAANEPAWADTVRAGDMAPSWASTLSRGVRALRGVRCPTTRGTPHACRRTCGCGSGWWRRGAGRRRWWMRVLTCWCCSDGSPRGQKTPCGSPSGSAVREAMREVAGAAVAAARRRGGGGGSPRRVERSGTTRRRVAAGTLHSAE